MLRGCCRARASPVAQPVLSPPGSRTLWALALQHIGMPAATAELEERLEDGCQMGMLSVEAWGTGLLLLMALGLPDQGRLPRGVCIQT